MSIKEIVNVVITRQTTAVSRAGFGTLLILDPHVNWPELTRTYSSASAMLDDGFESTDPAYLAALSAFSQTPSPVNIKIGRHQVDSVGVSIDTVIDSTDYVCTINGVDFTFDSGIAATAETIVIGLILAIEAGSEPVSMTDDLDGTFVIDADVAGVAFTVAVVGVNLSVEKPLVGAGTITDALAAVQLADPDWYALVTTTRLSADVQLAAAWIEAEIKIYISASSDANILSAGSTSDIAYLLNAAAYERTAVLYSADVAKFPDAAWFGKQLPTDAGSTTWMFKTLSGITFDELSDTESQAARAKSANTYEKIGGVNMTQEGTMASGEYIDIIRGVDQLQATMTENIFALLVNQPKVPFTDAGIASIEAEIRAALTASQDSGFLALDPAYTVTVPLAAAVSTADKADRFLPDVEFSATLAGAIHKVRVEGVVSL